MRCIVAALLAVSSSLVLAQAPAAQSTTDRPAEKNAKKDDKPADAKAKPRPRVVIKKDGAVGDDAPGGGGRSGSSSMGGTPGTPSGSFTRP